MFRVPVIVGFLTGLLVAGLLETHIKARVVWNTTASLPVGFYWRTGTTWGRGDFVELTTPDAVMNRVGTGKHLMKQVFAVQGDTVCWSQQTMWSGQTRVARMETHPLSPGLEGCRVLTEEEIVVVGAHPRSYDSRDFGPVDVKRVLYRVVGVWTW